MEKFSVEQHKKVDKPVKAVVQEKWRAPELLNRIGVSERLSHRPSSETAKVLFLAVAGFLTTPEAEKPLRGHEPDHIHIVTPGAPQERLEQFDARIEVSDFSAMRLNGERHAQGLTELMRPFLRPGTYRLQVSSQQRFISGAYFGLGTTSPHAAERLEVLGECAHQEGAAEDVITMYGAVKQGGVPQLIDTEIHEFLHTQEDTGLKYFVERVQAEDRIKFPYPELFLRARLEGRPMLWKEMANEYRSELLRVLRRMDEIPAGKSMEDAAVGYIQFRFPGSSAGAIRSDVRQIQEQNPSLDWPLFLKRSHIFERDASIEALSTEAIQRFIDPIQDPELREALLEVLDRTTPTEAMRLGNALNSTTDVPEEEYLQVQRLRRDTTTYQGEVSARNFRRFASHIDRNDGLWSDWAEIVQFLQRLSEHRLKMLSMGVPNHSLDEPPSDLEWDQALQEEMNRLSTVRFAENYNRLPEAMRASIRPVLEDEAHVRSLNFPLPSILRVRAQSYINRQDSRQTLRME